MSPGAYPIFVPKKKLDEAKALQRLILQREGYRAPLWRCLTEVEYQKRKSRKNEGFFGGFSF